jgi:tyrosyl-tRNA synthetase
MNLTKLLPHLKLVKSRAEARRLLAQGAIEVDGKKATDDIVKVYLGNVIVIKAGKRRFVRLVGADRKRDS